MSKTVPALPSKRTLLLVGVAAASFVALGLAARESRVSGQPSLQRPTPSVGPAGQRGPFTYIIPATPAGDPGEPTMYGPFRLIPWGYDKPLTHTPPRTAGGQGIQQTHDAAVIRQSPLYKEPSFVPSGYHLGHISGYGRAGADIGVTLQYLGGRAPIEARREYITERPIDILMPAPNSNLVIETGRVGSAEALIEYIRPNVGIRDTFGRVRVTQGDIQLIVSGDGIPMADLIRMIESLR